MKYDLDSFYVLIKEIMRKNGNMSIGYNIKHWNGVPLLFTKV